MQAADALAVAGMLGMGTIKTLLSKLMYGLQARGIDGSMHSFEARGRPACAAPRVRPTARRVAPRQRARTARAARCRSGAEALRRGRCGCRAARTFMPHAECGVGRRKLVSYANGAPSSCAQKPYYMVFNMFLGMLFCLLPSVVGALFAALGRARKSRRTGAHEPLLEGAEGAEGAETGTDAPAGADEPPPASGRLPVRGLKGFLVVGAPTVRLAAHAARPGPFPR